MKDEEYRVVIHYLGGRLAKGFTFDFNQDRDAFRLFSTREQVDGIEVFHHELKAVFFVKCFAGNPDYSSSEISEEEVKRLSGMKLKVDFKDGESMYASTRGYSPARKGFFILPLDKEDNNNKIYVVSSSTDSIEIIR
jgi:hypothetical protein